MRRALAAVDFDVPCGAATYSRFLSRPSYLKQHIQSKRAKQNSPTMAALSLVVPFFTPGRFAWTAYAVTGMNSLGLAVPYAYI